MDKIVGISKIINDCNLGLCVPTFHGESLASILKKICDKIGEEVAGGVGGCCYDFRNSTSIVFVNDHNIVTAHTVGGFQSFSAGNLAPIFTTNVATPTTTPFLSFSLNKQAANKVFAGPPSGANDYPDFRSLVMDDMPFSPDFFIQNQYLLQQAAAKYWIERGRIDDYLQISDTARLVTDFTNTLSVTEGANSDTGTDLRLSKLKFFVQVADTGFDPKQQVANAEIYAYDGQHLVLNSNNSIIAQTHSIDLGDGLGAPVISPGGYNPLIIRSSDSTTGYPSLLEVYDGNPSATGRTVNLSFAANRDNGTPIDSIFNRGTKQLLAMVGMDIINVGQTTYRGDLILSAVDATINSGLPTEYLRLKYDGRIIAPAYSTLLTAPTTTGVKHMLTCDENGLFSHEAIPSGGPGSVTSVGLQMPSAFSVANSPITSAGTLVVTGAGTTSQYIRGDGSLGNVSNLANIYNSDGTTTGARTVTLLSTLNFTGGTIGINQASPTGKLHLLNQITGQTNTENNGVILENDLPSPTSGNNKISPPLTFIATGTKLFGGQASHKVKMMVDILGLQASVTVGAQMRWFTQDPSAPSGTTYASLMTLTGFANNSGTANSYYGGILGGALNIGSVNGITMWSSVGNIAVGTGCLATNLPTTNSLNNTAIGYQVLGIHTTNGYNTGVGNAALSQDVSGIFNTAIGANAMLNSLDSSSCVAVGTNALLSNISAWKNTAIGAGSMENTTMGGFNSAVGEDSMLHNITGVGNSSIGWLSWSLATDGNYNIGIGYSSGRSISHGDNNVFIGSNSGYLDVFGINNQVGTVTNSIAIGANTYTTASNQTVIGNTDATQAIIRGGLKFPSYGVGTYGGSGVYALVVDASGNVLEDNTVLGSVTSVGLSMPSAFTVTNSPVTSSGTLTVTGAGTTSQVVRGDGSLGGVPLSSIVAATATNTIANANFAQVWNWDTLTTQTGVTIGSTSQTSGNLLKLERTGTLSTNSSFGLLRVNSNATVSGAFSSTAATILNTNSSGTTNIALQVSASNAATNNYGIIVNGGSVGIGTTAPTSLLHVKGDSQFGTAGSTIGRLLISGNTSGTITIQPAAAAGTYTLTLPTTDGNANEVLTTDGSGVLSWSNVSATPQTFQQVLTTGSTLTGSNTVAGAGFNFVWANNANYTIEATSKLFLKVANYSVASPGDVLTLANPATGEVDFQAPGAGSSGTVTSFSAGDLSPLFTTSEATVTTTPALTFNLSNAAANTWFGNNTGGSTTPAFNSAGTVTKADDTNVTLTLGGTPTASVLNSFSITAGWTGSLAVGRGGTAITSYTVGDIIRATGATTLSKLALGTANQILRVNAGATDIEWATDTGTGTVTNFSAGDLSGFFTTSEATTTTTPALTFAFVNAGAHTYWGNNTSSPAAPAYKSNAALTKTDDTNVTLTLGGAPSTSLLEAVSLTLGWTGTLGVARGGTNIAAYTAGDIIRATGTTTLTKLTLGTAGQLLRVNAGATDIEWATVAGSVTNFTSGNLSPLFTTSVATSTTTPALTYALSNAAANTYFGNATGGSTTPSYTAAGQLTTGSDTNIVLTVGGNASTSLLRDASITASWSGTLAADRGGTGIASYTAGDIIRATGATTLTKLGIGGPLQQLRVNAGGTDIEWATIASGITTLNTLTAAVQTLIPGTAGTDFGISSSGSIHTFNLPDASASARGVVTTGAQTLAGVKTFNVGITINETGVNTVGGGDFRVESDTNDHALFVDSTNNRVGIFTTAPANPLDITGNTQIFSGSLGIGMTPTNAAPLSLGGSGWTSGGLILLPSISSTPGSSPSILAISGTIIEATSGNHTIIAGINVTAPTVTAGAATTSDAATVYISGAPSATVSGGLYAMLIAGGTFRANGDWVMGTPVTYSTGGRNLLVVNTASKRIETIDPDVVVISAQTSTSYTLVLTDKGVFDPHNNASAITITIPPNSSVAFPIGTQISFRQAGAGQITFSPGVGVTLVGADSAFKTRVQHSTATLTKEGTNTWSIAGDLTV